MSLCYTGCLDFPWKEAVQLYVTPVQSAITATSLVEKFEQVRSALLLPPPFSVRAVAESVMEQHSTSVMTSVLNDGEDKTPAEYIRLFQKVLDIKVRENIFDSIIERSCIAGT